MDLGFIGLGVMGQPMALNLARAGTSIIVWNRSPNKCEMLRDAGARVAATPKELFKQARAVVTQRLVTE
jgi:3-hydroxyisobutyrate dehydrogenase